MLSAMNISTAHLSKFLATIDENGDGSITRDEFFFAAALGELAMDDAKIEMMFRYFDSDQDG
jgi:Ca2+-binding EF-hand superfamily protein